MQGTLIGNFLSLRPVALRLRVRDVSEPIGDECHIYSLALTKKHCRRNCGRLID